jgi:phospholipase/carboxylesterase
MKKMTENIHQGQPVIRFGEDVENAKLIVILLHGRGATAESMIPIAQALQMDGISFFIPQAAMNRWYPNTAFGPLEANEPDLSSALEKVDTLVKEAHQMVFRTPRSLLEAFRREHAWQQNMSLATPGNMPVYSFSAAP